MTQSSPSSMLRLNEVRIAGRLTHDPQVRWSKGDKRIVRLHLALQHPKRHDVTFVPVTVWNHLADHCAKRLSKGHAVYLEGRLRTERWKTPAGQQRSLLAVAASRMQFITPASAAALERAAVAA